jgi:hypothetical protein
MSPRALLRDASLRRALAGEVPIRQLVAVCSFCPDRMERTIAARAHGFDVTSQTCPACLAKLNVALAAAEAKAAA